MIELFFANAWDIDRSNAFLDWFYSSEFVFGIVKYAVCILIGIILAYFICTAEGMKLGINRDDVLVCVTFVVPLSILGARIWYMVGDGFWIIWKIMVSLKHSFIPSFIPLAMTR